MVPRALALRKEPASRVLRKAKANAVRDLRAAIARPAKGVIKADQTARAKAHPQGSKGLVSKAQANPPANNSAGAVNAADHPRVLHAEAIAVRVRRFPVPPGCSALRSNNFRRNLAAGRNRLDVLAGAVAKAALVAIKARVAAADAAASRADGATNRASSWPRPNRSPSCR